MINRSNNPWSGHVLDDVASELFSLLFNLHSPSKFKNGTRKLIVAKMWKYISGVFKVVNEKKNEKALKAAWI